MYVFYNRQFCSLILLRIIVLVSYNFGTKLTCYSKLFITQLSGLVKKKKFGAWSPCTFFYIKVASISVFRTLSNVLRWSVCENSFQLFGVKLRSFIGFWICIWYDQNSFFLYYAWPWLSHYRSFKPLWNLNFTGSDHKNIAGPCITNDKCR